MKRILSIILVILLCSFIDVVSDDDAEVKAAGPTYVSGVITQNTVWTESNGPYVVTDDTLVESNILLTIQPGVVVRFDSGSPAGSVGQSTPIPPCSSLG